MRSRWFLLLRLSCLWSGLTWHAKTCYCLNADQIWRLSRWHLLFNSDYMLINIYVSWHWLLYFFHIGNNEHYFYLQQRHNLTFRCEQNQSNVTRTNVWSLALAIKGSDVPLDNVCIQKCIFSFTCSCVLPSRSTTTNFTNYQLYIFSI